MFLKQLCYDLAIITDFIYLFVVLVAIDKKGFAFTCWIVGEHVGILDRMGGGDGGGELLGSSWGP